jgi:Fic family protein
VQESRFRETIFGGATRKPGERWAFTYYLPKPLPRELPLDAETVAALSEADAALGLLNGLGRLIHQPEVLLGPFLTREALASSRIEGTKASLTDVLQAEATPDEVASRSDDVAEVERHLAASRLGLERIETLPITQRLIKELHATLMQGVRGKEKLPGALRRTPVWVGSATATIDTARFVPPLPDELSDLLSDWEKFVNDPPRLPVLIRCALAHYQFETIHPFLDGNGRIGRLIVGLMLLSEGRLSRPLLYLSGYLETHRDEYYDHLQSVRETGEIQGYLQFFLQAVKAQSDDAVERAGRLVERRERYQADSRLDRSRVAALIPLIFFSPFLTTARTSIALGVTPQGARNLLERAEGYGWVRQLPAARRGRILWVAEEVLAIIDAPLSYEEELG